MAEIPCHMVRVRHLLELSLMTLVAIDKVQLIIAVDVAQLASCRKVSACQGKESRAMIEG
jgi:hypothetical protein